MTQLFIVKEIGGLKSSLSPLEIGECFFSFLFPNTPTQGKGALNSVSYVRSTPDS